MGESAEVEIIIDDINLGIFTIARVDYTSNAIEFNCISSLLLEGIIDNKIRYFEDKSLSDILKTLTSEMQISLKIDSSIASINIPYLEQARQTNLQVIENLASLFNATLKITDKELVFIPFSKLTKEVIVYDADIVSIELEDKKSGYRGVFSQYSDLKTGELVEIKTGDAPFYYLNSNYTDELLNYSVQSKLKEVTNANELHIKTVGKLDIQSGNKLIFQNQLAGGDTLYSEFALNTWVVIEIIHTLSNNKLYTQIRTRARG